MALITLPDNIVCSAIAHNTAFNANYDIVWSFDYSLSGGASSQGSFTTFLFDGDAPLVAGGPGPGGAYYSAGDYLSGGNPLVVSSVSGAVLGINFDTTGLFALSSDVHTGAEFIIPNSLSIRYGEPDFSFISTQSLTSLYTDFKFLLSSQEYNRLRFRLTDVGQTLKVDYRVEGEFVEILSEPVNLSIADTTSYKIGLGFTSPVSGSQADQAKFSIRNFHVEGKDKTPNYEIVDILDTSLAVYPVCALPTIEAPSDPIVTRSLTRIPEVPCPITEAEGEDRGLCFADFNNLSADDALDIHNLTIAGTYSFIVSSAPVEAVDPEPRPIIEQCSTSISDRISFSLLNKDIVEYPISYIATIDSSLGIVGFQYEVENQSLRFEVYYDDNLVVNTGYVLIDNDATYNLRHELFLRGEQEPATVTTPSLSTIYFDKTTSSPVTAEVRVFGPVNGADYTFSLLCPTPFPIPPTTDACGTLITGTNLTSPLSSGYVYKPYIIDLGTQTGVVSCFYNAISLPERFEILYNDITFDSGWVGSSATEYLDWINNFLTRVGEPNIESINANSGVVAFNKEAGDPQLLEFRVYAPLYNSFWSISATCPSTPTTTTTTTTTEPYFPYGFGGFASNADIDLDNLFA